MPATIAPSLTAFATEVVRLLIWLALLAAVFVPLERLFALRPQKILRPQVAADLGYYFLNSLLPGFVLGLPLAILATAAHATLPDAAQQAIAAAPLWARMALGLLVGELGAYWGHRWSHEIPLLWRFHAVHHEPEHIDWLVNTRTHPIDMVFTRLCALAPLYALGLAGPSEPGGNAVAAFVLIVGVAWGFFIHANVRWRFGALEHVVATPAFHHWHHTMSGPIDRNYAAMLPWLDKLFGTLHLPRGQWPADYGIAPPGAPAARPASRTEPSSRTEVVQ